MLLKTYIQRLRKIVKDIRDEVLIGKYTQLVTRLIECMEEENWQEKISWIRLISRII